MIEEDPERDRYPGVESEDHRTTSRRETHPYLSMLLYSRVTLGQSLPANLGLATDRQSQRSRRDRQSQREEEEEEEEEDEEEEEEDDDLF